MHQNPLRHKKSHITSRSVPRNSTTSHRNSNNVFRKVLCVLILFTFHWSCRYAQGKRRIIETSNKIIELKMWFVIMQKQWKREKTSTCIMNLSLCASFVAWFSALLCYVDSQHAFSLKHNLHTHTFAAQARGWKDSCCFYLLFFPSQAPGREEK